MIIPVRCWSCGKPVAHLWDDFVSRTQKGASKKEVLDSLGLVRYCCRGVFLGHVDLIDTTGKFKKF